MARHQRSRLALGSATAGAALVLLAGCTASHAASTAGRSHSVSPAPSATASASPTPAASTSAAPSPGAERCHTTALRASLVMPDAGAGQRYVMIKLTNRSTVTCALYGYGGLQLLDANRHPVPTRVHRIPPAAHRLSLTPGASATSQLHWTAVPGTGEPVSAACEPSPSFADVTPPDEVTSLRVPWTMGPVCQRGAIDQQPYR